MNASSTPTDPAISAWVRANAGAGKTHTLVDRVTRTLFAGADPGRVLCVTYTRAAAAEMLERLFRRLGAWALYDDGRLARELSELEGRAVATDELAAARRLFARALETPGGLKVRTIHAFCQTILARFPIEAGVPPHFQVIEGAVAAELRAEATARAIAEIEPESDAANALAFVAGEAADATFDAALRQIIEERARVQAGQARQPALRTRLAAALGVSPAASLATARAAFAEATPEAELRSIAEALLRSSPKDVERGEAIQGFLDAPESGDAFEAYVSVFFTKKGEPQKRLATGAIDKDGRIAEFLARERERVEPEIARRKTLTLLERSVHLMILGERVIDAYEAEKRRRGLMDYDDLIARTADLLSTSEAAQWVLWKLDGGIDHILIDEAQDTAPAQWEVIRRIADEFFAGEGAREVPRTIFAVGDEKQSIYSFQGAEPKRFAEMQRHFRRMAEGAGARWLDAGLEESWRSTPEVLATVDAAFAAPEARIGLTADGAPVNHIARRAGRGGLVELAPSEAPEETETPDFSLAPLDREPENSPRARVARAIAERVAGWLARGEILASRGRPIRPGDILILVQRRDAFARAMIRELKARDIAVAGADRMRLTDEIAVMDLMALAEIALNPEDDLTLAALLRSPLCGLSDDELRRVAHGRRGSLWAALGRLAAQGGAPYSQIHADLVARAARADFTAPFEFFAEALEDGGRARLLARLGSEANDAIDELLAQALSYGARETASLQGFVQWLRASAAEVKRDHGVDPAQIRVMTAHGAKGLEAEIVFLPDTCGRAAPARPLTRLDDALIWAPRKALDDARVAEARAASEAADAAERRRLLYVAMTRARDRLYVYGYEGQRGRTKDAWWDQIRAGLAKLSGGARDGEGPLRLEGVQSAPPEADEAGPLLGGAQTPPDWARRSAPSEPRPSRPLAPSRLAAELAEEAAPAASPRGRDAETRYGRGRLIHTLLQSLPDIAPGRRRAAAASFLANPARSLSPHERDEILEAAMGVIDDPTFAALFAPGSRAEAVIAGTVDSAGALVLSGRIDRLAVTDERVLIADFKTNRPAPKRLEDVDPDAIRQLAAYRMGLGRVYPGREIACALVWTDGPRLMAVPERALDAAEHDLLRARSP